jgi:hypothetical protein
MFMGRTGFVSATLSDQRAARAHIVRLAFSASYLSICAVGGSAIGNDRQRAGVRATRAGTATARAAFFGPAIGALRLRPVSQAPTPPHAERTPRFE